MTIFLILYGLAGVGVISVSRIDNGNSGWSSPGFVAFQLLLWPITVIYVWAQMKIIMWNGKVIWRRK